MAESLTGREPALSPVPEDRWELGARTYSPARRLPPIFLDTLLAHKTAAARANQSLGALPDGVAHAIARQAHALRAAVLGDPGPSIWQSGCGLEFNRWANVRIAQACTLDGSPSVTPAQVNCNQSTNDTIPTVLQLALLRAYTAELAPASEQLQTCLRAGAERMAAHRIMGRTFLRDAKWMPLADVLASWADLIQAHHDWLAAAARQLAWIPQGGYSLGNGDGVDPRFAGTYAACLSAAEGIACRPSPSPSTEIAGIRAISAFAGALITLCAGIEKVAADMLLLCSGPAHGFGDLAFEETADDSTTLAGKSNPKPITTILMACAYAKAQGGLATDQAARGQLALFTGFPVVAYALLDAVYVLAQQVRAFANDFVVALQPQRAAPLPTGDGDENA